MGLWMPILRIVPTAPDVREVNKMNLIGGFLLNWIVVTTEPTNRTERRQKAKTGSFRRQ